MWPEHLQLPHPGQQAPAFRAGRHKAQRHRRRRPHTVKSVLMPADPECGSMCSLRVFARSMTKLWKDVPTCL